MKLESLKSEKFRELEDSQMLTIKGGDYVVKTDGGGTYMGRPIVSDVHNFTTRTGTIYFADGTSTVVKTT